MNWEETILFIQDRPEYQDLLAQTYVRKNLSQNVDTFTNSLEFRRTVQLIRKYSKVVVPRVLDVGCGNGISTLGFALKGWRVTAVEPDPSKMVGTGAIKALVDQYSLDHLVEIRQIFAESMEFPNDSFDVVYARQAMHHASDLEKFVFNSVRSLKQGGLFITVRDHVITDATDKDFFLKKHPLHRFYGGENAYTESEYLDAMRKAGLRVIKVMKHYETVINYAPLSENVYRYTIAKKRIFILMSKIGVFKIPFVGTRLYQRLSYLSDFGDERLINGRLYSFIAIKL